jgi:tRNA acetyltransferase TAN1
MLGSLDLIVTCARHFEDETKEELQTILEELGDSDQQITITEFSGILTVDTTVNTLEIVKKIYEKLEDEPWTIRYIMRAIPVFQTVKTDVEAISDAALEQIQKMKPDETYRITIEKRNSGISSSEIISKIADKIKNKVSLEKYDWIILVQVLGGISGVSILKDSDVLSVEKTKRKSFD